jgi:hypothetical protein
MAAQPPPMVAPMVHHTWRRHSKAWYRHHHHWMHKKHRKM